ncbi:MAG: hypothetical protein WBO39_15590, partial [Ferruginibacter sp.]
YRSGRTIPLQWNPYAVHYSKILSMFKALGKNDKVNDAAIVVRNNGFDLQRIQVSTTHSKEINDAYLQQVQKDILLAEAYRIMMDWTGK